MCATRSSLVPILENVAAAEGNEEERMQPTMNSGKLLWVGWGDLARKAAPAINIAKGLGYEINALDVSEKPSGLKMTEPDRLFVRTSEAQHRDLVALARNAGFDAIYIANYGHQHIGSALEFYHYAPSVILAKPLDTCLDYLLTIGRDEANFRHLLNKLFVHDHYLNKPGIVFLRERMQALHSDHDFLAGMLLFLVERSSIERSEPHRIKALGCGMIFDLAVHLISIVQALVPEQIGWQSDAEGRYERKARSIDVVACVTAKSAGSLLGESTVIRGREAETFGVVELVVTETIEHESGERLEKRFPVLLVVGKGLPGEAGMTRDLKTVVLNFKDGAEVALDLDTYQFRGLQSGFLKASGYEKIDLTQRGINLPLVTAAQNGFALSAGDHLFQPYIPALENVRILREALRAAPVTPEGYRAGATTCREELNTLLRLDRRFSAWNLPQNFGNFHIGDPPERTIA